MTLVHGYCCWNYFFLPWHNCFLSFVYLLWVQNAFFLILYLILFCVPSVCCVMMLFRFFLCASLIHVSHLHSRIMLRKDMECHQWYNPKRNQVSWKTKKVFAREGVGKKERKKKLPTKDLQYFLEKSFTKLFHSNPTGIFPLYWDTFGTLGHLHWGAMCSFGLQCREGTDIVEPVQWRAPVVLRGLESSTSGSWDCSWRRGNCGMIFAA